MAGLVLDNDGRAVIHNRETGQTLRCSVPTALENVLLSKGVWAHGEAESDAAVAAATPERQAEPQPVITLRQEGVLPLPEQESAATPEAVDDLADVRTTPGDSIEKLEAIEREVDEANGKLSPAQDAALDHDGDKKAGRSKPKAGRSPEEDAERAALFAEFKERGVKVFAGSTTEKLREKLAKLNAG